MVLHKRKIIEGEVMEIDKLETNFEFFEKYNGRYPNVKISPLRNAPNKLISAPTEGELKSDEQAKADDDNTSTHAIDDQMSNGDDIDDSDNEQAKYFDPTVPYENPSKDAGTDAGGFDVKEC